MELIGWHYNVWKAFNQYIYIKTLTSEHITNSGNEKVVDTVYQIEENENGNTMSEEINVFQRCVFLEKDGIKYILPAKWKAQLPINVKESFNCYLKASDKTVYRFITVPTSVNIQPHKMMDFRSLIDCFNPMQHTVPRTWTFMKIQAVASKSKGGKYRLCARPECVDGDTEFLTSVGWKKISEYQKGDKVMQFHPETGYADLCEPLDYIKIPSKGFYHLKNRVTDQMLSKNHKVLYYTDKTYYTCTAEELVNIQNRSTNGSERKIMTCFKPLIKSHMAITDEDLRIQVAVICDGTFNKQDKCVIRIKKQRKKDRLEKLLNEAQIEYTVSHYQDGYSNYRFKAPYKLKIFNEWFWKSNQHQLNLIAEEVLHWDGWAEGRTYSTNDPRNCDFIQYCFTSQGYRTSITFNDRRGQVDRGYTRTSIDYQIKQTKQQYITLKNKINKTDIKLIPPNEGDMQYCFSVPSGFLVLRRKNKIFVTGNCGKNANDIILNLITNDNVKVSKPTLAKLETLFYYNQKVLPDEMTSLTPQQVREVEPLFLQIADESPTLTKHSMARSVELNTIDLTQSSCVFTYNDPASLGEDSKFFDDIWQNKAAFNSRYPALLLQGKIDSDMPKLNMQEANKIMKDNLDGMRAIAKNLVYYYENMSKELHGYDRTVCKLQGRQRSNFECVLDALDVYCHDQAEYDQWLAWVNSRLEEYQDMIKQYDYNSQPIVKEEIVL